MTRVASPKPLSRLNQFFGLFSTKMLIVAFGLFITEALLVINVPILWLIGQVNADDFYYYLVLAQNNASGLGPTFDGSELTNGFHPLYFWCLTILARLPVDSDTLIRLSLILLLMFHNATGLVINFGFRKRHRLDIGRLAALAWLLNPWPLAITLHGVEAPIATFLWAVVIFQLLTYRQKNRRDWQLTSIIILGFLIALAILARTDTLLFLAAINVCELYRAWRNRTDRFYIILNVSIINSTAFCVTFPWWWWNWQTFGMLMQVSGKAIVLITHGFDWQRPHFILSKIGATAQGYTILFILCTLLPLLLTGFLLWQRRYQAQPRSLVLKPVWHDLDFAWLAIISLACWYIGWMWTVQKWYMLPTILVVTIGAGLAGQYWTRKLSISELRRIIGFIAFVGVLFLVVTYRTIGFGFPHQERGYHIARWLNQKTAPDTVIGAWNSGIIGYFTERRVINLDGVVNNSVYHYKIERQTLSLPGLMDYIKSRQIDYLTDYEHFFIQNPDVFGLSLVYESPEHGFRIYEVDPSKEARWKDQK